MNKVMEAVNNILRCLDSTRNLVTIQYGPGWRPGYPRTQINPKFNCTICRGRRLLLMGLVSVFNSCGIVWIQGTYPKPFKLPLSPVDLDVAHSGWDFNWGCTLSSASFQVHGGKVPDRWALGGEKNPVLCSYDTFDMLDSILDVKF